MTAGIKILVFGAIFLFGQAAGYSDDEKTSPFKVASVHFEQNATDGDVEVVFEIMGGDDGLTRLTVTSPDGRTVVDFTAPDATTLGIRQFRFESPEPSDVKGLKSAYPEGGYHFTGQTTSGAKLQSKSTLHHTLPATTSFVQPAAGAGGVPVKDLKITWKPVENVAGYVLYVEQHRLKVSLTTHLPGTANAFVVPAGFLAPGTRYQLGIGTVGSGGNSSFIETTFTTAN